jgi:hypothetical protein
LQLRWDAELNDTGIITFNHSLDMWSLPAYAMKIDNSSQWQWKYYWHPLRAWTLTLHGMYGLWFYDLETLLSTDKPL